MNRFVLSFFVAVCAAACAGKPAAQDAEKGAAPPPALQFSVKEAEFQASVAARYPAPMTQEALLADLKTQGIECASYVPGAFDCQKVVRAGEMPCFDVWMVGVDAKDAAKVALKDVGYARRCLGALPP